MKTSKLHQIYTAMLFLTSSVAVVLSMSWQRMNNLNIAQMRQSNSTTENRHFSFLSHGGKSIPSNTECSQASYSSSFLEMALPLTSSECDNGVKFKSCFLRQVPGDGGCLFHSLAVSCSFLKYGKHLEFDEQARLLSNQLRNLSIDVLRKNSTVVMEFGETLSTESILNMVSKIYNLTVDEYCDSMYRSSTWGGGPEIVALSNYFQRPVHVFQLITTKSPFRRRSQFGLKICARFGSPDFDKRAPLRILCADGRFPHIDPGKQKEIGDHFLAIFPCSAKGGEVNNFESSALSSSSSSISLPTIHPRARLGRSKGLKLKATTGENQDESFEADEYDLSWVLSGQISPFDLEQNGETADEVDMGNNRFGGNHLVLLRMFLKGLLLGALTKWLFRSNS